jgi:hypothetical protein
LKNKLESMEEAVDKQRKETREQIDYWAENVVHKLVVNTRVLDEQKRDLDERIMWTDISPLPSLDTSFTLLLSVEHFLFKMTMSLLICIMVVSWSWCNLLSVFLTTSSSLEPLSCSAISFF